MKIAVIGLGGTGSAALRFLAQSGHEVVGYERFRVGHTQGSSHGESRIIRYAYPSVIYTNLMGHAYPLWDELENASGDELFVRCGGVFIDRPDSDMIGQVADSLESAELPHEILDPQEMERRFPVFRMDADEVALWQPESGFLRPSACVAANVRLAAVAGAHILEETLVTGIRAAGDGVLVSTPDGDVFYDRALITAGPWMAELLQQMDLPLTVTRQQVAYVKIAGDPEAFAPENMPVWIDTGAPDFLYGFPTDGRIPGIKLAMHRFGEPFDPNRADRPVSIDEAAALVEYANRRFHGLEFSTTYDMSCLYTVAPNEDFIIDSVPDIPAAHFISGCSGHGFKFTVLLGRIGADLALGQAGKWDIEAFGISTSASG